VTFAVIEGVAMHVPRPARSRTHLARTLGLAGVATVLGLVSVPAAPAVAAAAPGTSRVSVATGGGQADAYSLSTAVSADGRYIAFSSDATNLVPGDTNGQGDIFLRDQRRGTTTRISVSSTGEQADHVSGSPTISANGRYVAFASFASNLVPGDTNEWYDIFVHDTRTGTTERINVSADGDQADGDSYQPSITADGRYVIYESGGGNLVPGAGPGNVLRYDRRTGATTVVSVNPDGRPAGESFAPTVSPNGRYVAFVSFASTLVSGDTNAAGDIFVRDLTTGRTVRASVTDDERQVAGDSRGTSVTDNGLVGFWSEDPAVVPDDTNGAADAFVRDTVSGTTVRVSVSNTGAEGNQPSADPDLSGDGRYVVFNSGASNLVGSDTNGYLFDVFLRDLETGRTLLVSRNSAGEQGDLDSVNPNITTDGRSVVYDSNATNLVDGDTNDELDVFITGLPG
jgi:Tol biopolymer transport system component